MCGRFSNKTEMTDLSKAFELDDIDAFFPMIFNASPGMDLPVITSEQPKKIQKKRWGLIPSFAKDPTIGQKMINARSETIQEKPSFRKSFQNNRCLIPATGFFEWKKVDRNKQPYFIHLNDSELFSFAGIWSQWIDPKTDTAIDSFSIVTKEAEESIRDIHKRMPVMLHPNEKSIWLEQNSSTKDLKDLINRDHGSKIQFHPVSSRVNSPQNNDASLLEPVKEMLPPQQEFLF